MSNEKKRPRKSVLLDEGEEIRGRVMKLYPTARQTRWLYECQDELRIAWNVLCEGHRDHLQRCVDKATEDGAIAPLPVRPAKDAPLKERRSWNLLWERACIGACVHVRKMEGWGFPKLGPGKEHYAPLMLRTRELAGRDLHCSIQAYRAVIARFSAARVPKKGALRWRPPRFKKQTSPWLEHGMIQTRCGERLRRALPSDDVGRCRWVLEIFGERIGAHAGDFEPRTPIQGCSIVRRADGWYLSTRSKELPREPRRPMKGPIAICLGLEYLCTTNEGLEWENPRGNVYAKLCAWMDEKAAELGKEGLLNEQWDMLQRRKRHQLRFHRKTMALIYQEILPSLSEHDIVVVGTMTRSDVQGPQCKLGPEDDGGALSGCGILLDKLRLKLRERLVQIDFPGVDDASPEETARDLLSKWTELREH